MKPEQTLYLTIKILSFGLALFYRLLIPNSKRFQTLKYVFNGVAGFFIVSALYKSQVLIIVLFGCLAYLGLHIIPRSANRVITPVTFFVLSFLLTTYDQIKHVNELRYSFYIAGMQFALRISSLVFCLYDGATIDVEDEKVPQRVKDLALKEIPSPLKFFSYIFVHCNVLNPPPFEYKVYENSIEDEYETKQKIDWIAILHRLKWVLIYFFLIGFTTKRFGWTDDMVKSKYTQHMSIFEMYYNCIFAFTYISFKLIFAGMFAEMVCVTAGIGYKKNRKEGQDRWDYIKCVDPLVYETSVSVRTRIKSWNMTVERWFRNYCYFRLPFNSFVNRMATGMLAATWHGSYPGIFIFYACVIAVSQVYVTLYKKFDKFEGQKDSWLAWIFAQLAGRFLVQFMCGSIFFCQTWDEIVAFHSKFLNWGLFIFIATALVAVNLLPNMGKKKKKRE